MKYLLFILFVPILQNCSKNKTIIVTQFFPYPKMEDTVIFKNKLMVYTDHFFLIQYYSNSESTKKELDNFIGKYISSNSIRPYYHEDRIYIYKQTNKTNNETIKANPRELDRYSNDHDLVYRYIYIDGNFSKKIRIEKGEEVETNSPTLQFKTRIIENDTL